MRKGDATRQEILRVSESLFCSKGYDAASVQDILDVMHGSKGGFYHHFASKEDVLRTICEQHAAAAAAEAAKHCAEEERPLAKLNMLLRDMLPFSRSDPAFFCMLLPLLDRGESVAVRIGYQNALASAFSPAVAEAIRQAVADDTLRPVAGDSLTPLMAVMNAFWLEVSLQMLGDIRACRRPDPAAVTDLLHVYRRSVEALLDAPFGTIVLCDLVQWQQFAEDVASRCRL